LDHRCVLIAAVIHDGADEELRWGNLCLRCAVVANDPTPRGPIAEVLSRKALVDTTPPAIYRGIDARSSTRG